MASMADWPRVGLALGGGGARGLAHIGVLKVLEAEGMPGKYRATIKGLTIHEGEIIFAGRLRR